MSDGERIWVVDRIVGERVVLVQDETGVTEEVARAVIPGRVREGDVLRVPSDPTGQPVWSRAETDAELRRERLDESRDAIDRLKKRDPGGNVKL